MNEMGNKTLQSAHSSKVTDIYSREKRSNIMSRVRDKNSRAELTIRSLLHKLGYRFRLHRKNLPGKPDIVLPKYKAIIFVNGCFWHQHKGCSRANLPKSNRNFWSKKLKENSERDCRVQMGLKELGWRVLVIWGCEILRNNHFFIRNKVNKFLKTQHG